VVDFDQRALGNLEAQVQSLSVALSLLTVKLDHNSAKLDEVERTLSEAKGGWRVLMIVGGAAGSIGAGLSYIASLLVPPKV